MRGILADHNAGGHLAVVLRHLQSEEWREIWESFRLSIQSFADLGFVPEVSDAVLWQACQQEQLVLITCNRNKRGSDSLEATIRTHNTPSSLPVMTVAKSEEIFASGAYAERVAVRLLEYLFDMDNLRGTGRLYLP